MSGNSEQSAKITAVKKTAKVKDPRKVEAGKRLAKISREAKERKAKQKQLIEAEAAKVEITDYIDFRYFIGSVGLVAALFGLYSYNRDKIEIRENSRANKLEHSEKEKEEKNSKQQSSRDKVKKCSVQGFKNFD